MIRMAVLAVGLALSGAAGAAAQGTDPPADRSEGGLASDPTASGQESLTQSGQDTESRALEVALQRRFNELRAALLEERGRSIDRWLIAIAIVLAYFGIVVAIAGSRAYDSFRRIEAQARDSARAAREHAAVAEKDVLQIMKNKRRSAELLEGEFQPITNEDEPQPTLTSPKTAREDDPDASLIQKTIDLAIAHEGDERIQEAVGLWRSIANVAESGDDKALLERACYAAASLLADSDPEQAIADFTKVLKLDPKNAKAYGNRGIAKARLDRFQEAIADFTKVLKLDPNNAKAYGNRGTAKARLDRHFEAIRDFDKAIDLAPRHSMAFMNRGVAKGRLGLHKQALEDFEQALRLDPENAKALKNRDIASSRLGVDANAENGQ